MWNFFVIFLVIISVSLAYHKYSVFQFEERDFFDDPKKYARGPWRFVRFGHGVGYGVRDPGIEYERGFGYVRAYGQDYCPDNAVDCAPYNPESFQYEGDRREPYFGWRPRGTAAADRYKDPYRKARFIDNRYLIGISSQ